MSEEHRRRPRYSGKNPRRFDQKYKEHAAELFPETQAKVLAAGKTPAGTHRPIMVAEILAALDPRPGDIAVDATLGYGGHAAAILPRVRPGGRLIALDVDPVELPKTAERLRGEGFTAHRCNYAGLAGILAQEGVAGADVIVADLGVSSMQIDDPARGFSLKEDGALDMRMNPARGLSAAEWLRKITPAELQRALVENADEPQAEELARRLAQRDFATTSALRQAVLAQPRASAETVQRVFQAIRIAVNDEFSALDTFLHRLPECLASGGRVAILTFHSGEDRRVKHAFAEGLRRGDYAAIAEEVTRAGAEERRANPRSTSAKLRWARRT